MQPPTVAVGGACGATLFAVGLLSDTTGWMAVMAGTAFYAGIACLLLVTILLIRHRAPLPLLARIGLLAMGAALAMTAVAFALAAVWMDHCPDGATACIAPGATATSILETGGALLMLGGAAAIVVQAARPTH